MTIPPPAWLDAPPTNAVDVLPVKTRSQGLPFSELTWPNFERLVLRLVRRQATVRECSLYGVSGQAQEGLDILASKSDGSANHVCYQCKKVKSFSDRDIAKAVTKFLEGKWAKKTSEYNLSVAIALNTTQQQDEIARQRQRLQKEGIILSIWDGSDGGLLTEQLKQLPELVADFFGQPWVRNFNGSAAAAKLDQRLDGNELGNLRQRLHRLYTTVFAQHDPGLRTSAKISLGYIDRYVPIDVVETTETRESINEKTGGNAEIKIESETSPQVGSDHVTPRTTSQRGFVEIRQPAFAWVSKKEHCVVLGEPGYGKSALLRCLALSLLDPESAKLQLTDHEHLRRLPVWMSFPRYASSIKVDPSTSVDDYIANWLHQHSYDDVVPLFDRALKRSEVFLLVDGLDEGSSELHRREALDRIITFSESRSAAVICTSRPRGFNQIGTPGSWKTAAIAPMNNAQVKELAARWFTVTEQDDPGDEKGEGVHTRANRRAEAFLSAANENRRTQDLSRNPLLCHALIELFRFSHRLPEARVGAYEKIIDLLLSQHPAARAKAAFSEAPQEALGLRESDLRGILIRLASDFQSEPGGTSRNIDRCRAICATYLEDDTYGLGLDKPEAQRRADESLELLIGHYGLLVERSPNEIGFVHLSIQEYLAAEFRTCESEGAQLNWIKDVWLLPAWRESLNSWFGIQGARGNMSLTGRAAQLLAQEGHEGEWQRLRSLEFRTELACTDMGLPISECRKAVNEAALEIETSPFPTYRVALARNITFGAVESAVSDTCAKSIGRLVPGRPSYGRARLLRELSSWEASEDLWAVLVRGLHDEELQCRQAAVDSLVSVFSRSTELEELLGDLARQHPRPEVRATALRGLSSNSKWREAAISAAAINRETCHVELMLSVCAVRIQSTCHDKSDLDRMWRIWTTRAEGYLYRSDLIDSLVKGWPSHPGIRKTFMSVLEVHGSTIDDQVPLTYLLRCYPDDNEIASRVSELFDRYGLQITMSTETIWPELIAGYRGHPQIADALRRSLAAHKEKYESIFYHPNNVPGFIVIGDNLARDELLDAFPSIDKDMGRYWIVKTLVDGWPNDEKVIKALKNWAKLDADSAAALAEWATLLYPQPVARERWLKDLVANANARIVAGAVRTLVKEFPDEETRELVKHRMLDKELWAYHHRDFQGLLARYYPDRQSSVETVEESLAEIDGPQLADFASAYEHNEACRSRILAASVAAPVDVRMAVAKTIRERAIDIEASRKLTPQIFAEENSAVRATGLIARAKSSRGNNTATEALSGTLAIELSSLGTYYESRRRTAMAGFIELERAERATDLMAESQGGDWTYRLHTTLDKDPVSIDVIVRNWETLRPLLAAKGLTVELPIESLVNNDYAQILDQSPVLKDSLDEFLLGDPPQHDPINYFYEIARRFPRSEYLRTRLLSEVDGPPYQEQIQVMAARMLTNHFGGDEDVLATLIELFDSPTGGIGVRSPGVIAYLAIGWPGSAFESELRSTSPSDHQKWCDRDQLLAALALQDRFAANSAARAMLQEPLQDWRFKREAKEALRLWSRHSISDSALTSWLVSPDGTYSITSLSLISASSPEQRSHHGRLIEEFNQQMSIQGSPPRDGLDAIAGLVTGWPIRASAVILDSNQF